VKSGEVSGILERPKGRQWIAKLVNRKTDESIDFDPVKVGSR
jgi:hypothetical protein